MGEGEIILKGKGQRIGLAILIGVMIMFLTLTILKRNNVRAIKNDFEKAIGVLTKYEDASSVEGTNINLEYTFDVESKTYSRKIRAMSKFKRCQDNPMNCIGKKYWVIYKKGDPENSLVNIELEFQEGKPTPFPESLDDFF